MKKKIHERQLTLKNIHAMAYKNSNKEFDKKKIPAARKLPTPPPPPPIPFLMVRPLGHKRGSLYQAVLAETVETGAKIEVTHVLRRKLRKD